MNNKRMTAWFLQLWRLVVLVLVGPVSSSILLTSAWISTTSTSSSSSSKRTTTTTSFSSQQRPLETNICCGQSSPATLLEKRGRALYLSAPATTTTEVDQDLLETIREGLAEKDLLDEWNLCVEFLTQDFNFAQRDEAEELLATGLMWEKWAKAPSYRPVIPELPNLKQLQTAIQWLREGPFSVVWQEGEGGADSGATPSLLLEAIRSYPNLYLVDPSARYEEALESAPSEYQEDAAFLSLVAEDPSVLKHNYNCYACTNECDKCWAFYELQKNR